MTKPLMTLQVIKPLLREPLFHFAIIAAVLLVSFALFSPANNMYLEISQREIDARIFLAEISNAAELAPDQINAITAAYIEEQVLVREARTRGLDNDTRIHDILAQKLRHILSAEIIQPTASELNLFYSENAARYISTATVSVDELVFNRRDQLPAPIIEALSLNLPSSKILDLEAGSAAPLPRVSQADLSNIFNPTFAEDVFTATDEAWSGPYLSNRGQHWLKVIQRSPEHLPQLSEIADLVRLDWIATEEDLRLSAQVKALVNRYRVVVLNDSE
ncbi:MAG: hypothetical protein ACI945_001610 [Pseudohongiellaceae bacterium]|jgi:hypothetical protein